MKIRVLLFAHYRDLAGSGETEVELPPGSTAADLVHVLRARPGLAAIPASPVVAINQEYAAGHIELSDGDEVALLPPVAGG